MHTFTYFYADVSGQMTIDLASWEVLHLEPELEELRIHTCRKSLDIVLGSGILGSFVFIPSLCFGFSVQSLRDAGRTSGNLSSVLDIEDASAVASALQDYVSL